jgi:exodeoxyribonuclease VII large subunit
MPTQSRGHGTPHPAWIMNLFILSVTDLTNQIKQVVESTFSLVWVVGEISSLKRAGSGHLYLNLKDANAVMPAVVWKTTAGRLRFKLHDGLEVVIRGRLSVYPPHGEYRLMVDELHPKGMGAAELALKQLKEKLTKLGYFDPARKRPLPTFPRRLVLVTSATGAAVRDMLEILGRRWPIAEVWVCPTRVQGAQAAEHIAWNFTLLNRLGGIDAVILGRGGGSADDLAVFNDERVVQAIFDCRYPVISAVGHEIDVTLADLVADKRALTPSEAAELATPDRAELLSRLDKGRLRLRDLLLGHLQTARKGLAALAQRRVFREPLERVRDLERRLDDWHARLSRAVNQRLTLARKAVEKRAVQLDSLSPLKVLARGYSLTRKNGALLRSAAQAHAGDVIETRLHEGTIVSRVE